MRVLVVGAGAIGMLVGGELALAGHDVTLVARPALAERVRRDGLHVVGPQGARLAKHVGIATSVADAATCYQPASSLPFDWLALTVKAYDVPGAVAEIREAFASPPPVVTFQNGIGSEETAAGMLGADRVASVSVTIPTTVPGVGTVEARKKGGMAVAPYGERGTDAWHASRAIAAQVVAVLTSAGFDTRRYEDYRTMKWSKLLLNMLGNASSAILDMPPGAIFADPRLFRLEADALREALAVMRAWRIPAVDLPGVRAGLIPWALRVPSGLLRPVLTRLVAEGRGGKMPSLHIDLVGGKGKSEVVYLNGAVVEWGARKGVPTPVNRALTDTLTGLMAGRLRWEEFRGRPARLLERVNECASR